jgi:hypothetical protein
MIKANIIIHYCALIVTFKSFQLAFCHCFFEMQIGLKSIFAIKTNVKHVVHRF